MESIGAAPTMERQARHRAHRHGRLLRLGRGARQSRAQGEARHRRRGHEAGRRERGELRGARVRRAFGDASLPGAAPVPERGISSGRMERYVEVSRVVMKCLEEFSPLVEQVSIDEAFVDLTGTEHLFGDPGRAARRMKARIREETSLTCSVGVSVSKLLAKIASDMNKPDGLTIVPPADVGRFLDALPVGKVPGVGEKSGEELAKLGIRLVGDIVKYTPRSARGAIREIRRMAPRDRERRRWRARRAVHRAEIGQRGGHARRGHRRRDGFFRGTCSSSRTASGGGSGRKASAAGR